MPDSSVAYSVATGRQTVLERMSRWLAEGQRAWLCTIVDTWGSSPRPVGSWLAIAESGHWSGSVSGGCLEEDLLRRTAEDGPEHPVFVDYGITDDDRDHFQLPCGGRIRLLIEPFRGQMGLDHVQALAAALRDREPVVRRVPINGAPTLEHSVSRAGNAVHFDGEQLLHALQPECRLLLIGAGEVARYVFEFATAADFAVTLCEPREAFAAGWSFEGIPLDRRLPDDLISTQFGDAWSGILALAHDPRIDDMGLLAALHSSAFYIGAMGSKRTSEARRERLASLGLEKEALERLRAPIGVDIPSKTPAEIAVSIVADLIAARHHLRGAGSSL